jgi:hypothetical protein
MVLERICLLVLNRVDIIKVSLPVHLAGLPDRKNSTPIPSITNVATKAGQTVIGGCPPKMEYTVIAAIIAAIAIATIPSTLSIGLVRLLSDMMTP